MTCNYLNDNMNYSIKVGKTSVLSDTEIRMCSAPRDLVRILVIQVFASILDIAVTHIHVSCLLILSILNIKLTIEQIQSKFVFQAIVQSTMQI